jgi:hypothetical protein
MAPKTKAAKRGSTTRTASATARGKTNATAKGKKKAGAARTRTAGG